MAYFLSSKKKKKIAIVLMQVVQKKDKSLHEYLARFSWTTLGIKDIQISTLLVLLMNGTWNHSLKMSLSKTLIVDADLLKKGDKYVNVEDVEKVMKNLR